MRNQAEHQEYFVGLLVAELHMPKDKISAVAGELELTGKRLGSQPKKHAGRAEVAPLICSVDLNDCDVVRLVSRDVIHEFNNLLTTIIGYAEIAAISLDPKLPVYEYIANIIDAGNGARQLIEKLEKLQPRQPEH